MYNWYKYSSFIIITSYANNNEVESLEHIDSLSSEILDCPNDSILKLIELLGDKVKLVQLFTYMKENDNIINFINPLRKWIIKYFVETSESKDSILDTLYFFCSSISKSKSSPTPKFTKVVMFLKCSNGTK